MRVVVDMNLAPEWAEVLSRNGIPAVHWSAVSDPRAPDAAIMAWAREHDHVVFTHDLDFGTLLAHTRAAGPSVVQVRAQDVLPSRLGTLVVEALRRCEDALTRGALVTIDESRERVRLLPLVRDA
jgi:predicted nuclease of predicted toxin-antitoxin system